PQRDRLGRLELRYDPRDISHVYIRDPETREFRPVERRDGMLAPMTLWEHEADRSHQRSANARTDVEKVTLRRQITEIASGQKPSKIELRNAVRRAHAVEAAKPYDALRPAKPAPAEHPVRHKRRLPVEDW
ncbi:transposase, partial [Mesorhizobium sp. M7A.F.Ca.MR.362.00.0.0]